MTTNPNERPVSAAAEAEARRLEDADKIEIDAFAEKEAGVRGITSQEAAKLPQPISSAAALLEVLEERERQLYERGDTGLPGIVTESGDALNPLDPEDPETLPLEQKIPAAPLS